VEELQMEEIPKDTFPVTKTSLQSSSSWRQAESAVFAEADSKISILTILTQE
jgi:hypothetical protein